MNTHRICAQIPSIGQLRQHSAQVRARGSSRSPPAFVLSGGGNQAVSQVGMLRVAQHGGDPDVVVGCSTRERGTDRWLRPIPLEPSTVSRRDVGAAVGEHHLPRRSGCRVEPAHPRRPPLLRRGPAHCPRSVERRPRSRTSPSAAGGRRRPRHGRGGGVRMREAAPGSPGLGRRCPACSHPCGSTDGCSSTAPWSTRCRSRTLAGPVDRVYVLNVSVSSCVAPTGRRSTCSTGVARSVASSASSSSCGACPRASRSSCSPRLSTTGICSTSPIRAATSTRRAASRSARSMPPRSPADGGSLRRSWWRRTAG